MKTLLRALGGLWKAEAASSVEYAVILAAILLAALAGIAVVGERTDLLWSDARTQMDEHGVP